MEKEGYSIEKAAWLIKKCNHCHCSNKEYNEDQFYITNTNRYYYYCVECNILQECGLAKMPSIVRERMERKEQCFFQFCKNNHMIFIEKSIPYKNRFYEFGEWRIAICGMCNDIIYFNMDKMTIIIKERMKSYDIEKRLNSFY